MSSHFRNLRRYADTPAIVKNLAEKLAEFQASEIIDADMILGRIGRIDTAKLIWENHEEHFLNNSGQFQITEPDGTNLYLWYTMDEGSDTPTTMTDHSGGGRHGTVLLGSGVKLENKIVANYTAGKRLSKSFFCSGNGTEVVRRAHDSDLVVNQNQSFSFWFYPTELSLDGGTSRRCVHKFEDANNGFQVTYDDTARIQYVVKKAGTGYSARCATGALLLNAWNLIVCLWQNSTNTPTIVVNNVAYTNVGGVPGWNSGTTDLVIGRQGNNTTSGRTKGYIDDFRYWQSYILTAAEYGNLWTNKLSIVALPGRVGLCDVAA